MGERRDPDAHGAVGRAPTKSAMAFVLILCCSRMRSDRVRAWPLTCTTNRLSRETLLAMRVAEPSDFSRSHTRIGITTILHNAPQLHYSLHPTQTILSSPSRGPWERQPLPKSSRTVLVLRCPKGICKKSLLTKIPFHGSHFPDPKIWQKRTQKLWYTAGWESRSVGWVTGVDARATGTRRLRGDDTLASIPSHAHRGGGPLFLEQISSTDDCSCPLAPRPCWALSHTRMCASHRACAAAAISNDHPLCTMDAEKQEPQPEPLEACVPPS